MTKTRRAGFSKKRRRGGRKTITRKGGKRRSRVTKRGGRPAPKPIDLSSFNSAEDMGRMVVYLVTFGHVWGDD